MATEITTIPTYIPMAAFRAVQAVTKSAKELYDALRDAADLVDLKYIDTLTALRAARNVAAGAHSAAQYALLNLFALVKDHLLDSPEKAQLTTEADERLKKVLNLL
jgi:hypothetical protein